MDTRRTTVVAEPTWQVSLIWVGFPVVGAVALWLLKLAAKWILSLPFVPFDGPLRLLNVVPEPWGTIGVIAIGAVLGLVVSFIAAHERLSVAVRDDNAVFYRGGKSRTFDRTKISGVFLDGKDLVLLGLNSEELARDKSDLIAENIANAFQSHGYPWLEDGDPHRADYRRWIEGNPELPQGADQIFKARAEALRNLDQEDAAGLREELTRMGLAVREDKKKRQFWRHTTPR
ncbi:MULTISPECIES: hypothetical protein [Actinosynnema]|uniref:YqeB family protein n=1 Tax=Actinosynnema TaxID=40566 RepID=UPI0020A4774F|nr:hypothetical protein [Actinosynnema pretiosum]MCP2093197.1 hypothetical protein [Actinosynnema pretiosum]